MLFVPFDGSSRSVWFNAPTKEGGATAGAISLRLNSLELHRKDCTQIGQG
jgi:hypothetical protein